jgi:hypothetical protein
VGLLVEVKCFWGDHLNAFVGGETERASLDLQFSIQALLIH